MRRFVIEWLLISAIGCFLASVALLALSSLPSWSPIPFALSADHQGHRAYVLIREGRASLFNQIDFSTPGAPRALVVDPRRLIFPRATANHQFSVPGLAFQFCRLDTDSTIWSLEFSLAIPAALSLIATALLIQRWRRGHQRDSLVRVEPV